MVERKEEKVTLNEFFKRVIERPKFLRQGQQAFNVLHEMRPDLANEIRATPLDPFYLDERLPDFYNFLYVRWNDE